MDDVSLRKTENCKENLALVYFRTHIYAKPIRAYMFKNLKATTFLLLFLDLQVLYLDFDHIEREKLLYSDAFMIMNYSTKCPSRA